MHIPTCTGVHTCTCVNPILTGLFESKFLLGGGGQFDPPPFRSRGPFGADRHEILHVKSIAKKIVLPKTVYLLYYYNLCKLDASYHIFINISNK